MAQSIRKRLDGNLPEFLQDVKRYGRWEAMEKWGLERSYLPVAKIILEETKDENFGLNPTAKSYLNGGIQGLLRELVSTFADYVIRSEIKERELRTRLDAYDTHGKRAEHQIADEITGLVESLKSSVSED